MAGLTQPGLAGAREAASLLCRLASLLGAALCHPPLAPNAEAGLGRTGARTSPTC